MRSKSTTPLKIIMTSLLVVVGLLTGCDSSHEKTESHNTQETRQASGGVARVAGVTGVDFVSGLAALGDTVVGRALRGDTLGLLRIMVSDSMYRRNVYPLSPAYNQKSQNTFEFVLGMNNANSAKGLRRLLYDVQSAPELRPTHPALDTFDVAEGKVFLVRRNVKPEDGVVPWSSAFCSKSGCQVISYTRAGAPGKSVENDD